MALEEFLQNQENESQPIVSLPRTFKRAVLYYSALCVTSPVLVLPGRVCASWSGTPLLPFGGGQVLSPPRF